MLPQCCVVIHVQIYEYFYHCREKCFREISLVNSLGHENIIAYLESFIVNKELILVFEYAEVRYLF